MSITMLTDDTGYIPGFSNAGVIRCENGVILIDNGWGVKEGRHILEILQQNNMNLVAIVNTHTHVDHAGADDYLHKKTGCKIYTTLFESLLLQGFPMLFPMLFTGTLNPIHKGLEAVSHLAKSDFILFEPGQPLTIDGVTLDIVDLAGHSYGQAGIVYQNILFCGDAIMDQDTMRQNKLTFLTHPTQQRRTLDFIKNSHYDWYVPSHGTHFHDPVPTCNLYLALIDNVETYIFETIATPATFEDILAYVTKRLHINVHQFSTYCTCKDAIGSILNELVNQEKIVLSYQDNKMYYCAV